jgi:hypothetical protein
VSSKHDTQEKDKMLEMIKNYPRESKVVETLLEIQKLADELKFPIHSFSELSKEMGDKLVTVANRTFKIQELKEMIPSYYFPFASKQNFIEKAEEIFLPRAPQIRQHFSTVASSSTQAPHPMFPNIQRGRFPVPARFGSVPRPAEGAQIIQTRGVHPTAGSFGSCYIETVDMSYTVTFPVTDVTFYDTNVNRLDAIQTSSGYWDVILYTDPLDIIISSASHYGRPIQVTVNVGDYVYAYWR